MSRIMKMKLEIQTENGGILTIEIPLKPYVEIIDAVKLLKQLCCLADCKITGLVDFDEIPMS